MVVHEAEGVFGASFPDYLGAMSVVHDRETLRAKVAAMLTAHIEGLQHSSSPVSTPRTLARLGRDVAFPEAARTAAVETIEVLALNVLPEPGAVMP
jgi:predicted RNase H-like HicB family nuclease